MTLRLYNTLTKSKDAFTPRDLSNVRMYVCGPTVYDFAHIGNARPVIVFDVLYRLLRHLYPGKGNASDGSRVTYVRNITDVDDKINARAAERGITIRELTEETARTFNEDVAALGCLPPTHTPRATDNIAAMIAMIEKLIAAGHAYATDGHVLFDVASKPDYGKLARRSLDEMIAGARVDIAPYKKSPMDFVLWKPSDAATPGWDSPWGRGRPGWHLECSAMIQSTFPGADTIDIHGGGIDLVFPHHENEIAQSEGAHHGHPLAQVWMHNGFLQVEGEKMAKSAGNFYTIRDLLHTFNGDVLRLQMLSTHYRSPIDWTVTGATAAKDELFSWADFLAECHVAYDAQLSESASDEEFFSTLSDDLNTPLAITRLRKIFHQAQSSNAARDEFVRLLRFFGFKNLGKRGHFDSGTVFPVSRDSAEREQEKRMIARSFHAASGNNLADDASRFQKQLQEMGWHVDISANGSLQTGTREDWEELKRYIEDRVAARNAARKVKNWAEADRIRDELLAQGIVLKDGPGGTTWR